jgi:hypothetical protein
MPHENLSRRTILAGAVTAPALALPVSAIAATELGDPIFTAIEAHRGAFMGSMRSSYNLFYMDEDAPEYAAATAARDADYEVRHATEEELALTVPTTMAGVLALLAYLHDFDTQALALPENPDHWHSDHEAIQPRADDGILDRYSGEPIELPFMFWIMRNVRTALQTLAVQA